MAQVIITEHIAAPPAAVWTFISDLRRIPEWVVGTKEMLSISTEAAGVGTEYRELSKFGPTTAETAWRITTFRAPSVQTHECRSPLMHVVLTMTVVPEGSGARLIHRTDARVLPRVRPLGWLMELILRPQVANDMRQSLQQAKRIIEQDYGAMHSPGATSSRRPGASAII